MTSMTGTLPLLTLFLGRLFQDRKVWLLPVTAYAVVGALALTVTAGARSFWGIEGDWGGFYTLLSIFALMLLSIPLMGLAGSAARLLARRRDERLSSLRLIGASSWTVRSLAVTEAAVLAAVGLVVGTVVYLALMPLVGLLQFAGRPIGVAGMWLGVPMLLLVLGVLMLMAVGSSVMGLQRIEISPLGVRTRQAPARAHWVRALVAVGAVVAAQVLVRSTGAQDMAMVLVMMLIGFGLPMLALHFIGPWLIAVLTRRTLRRADTPERLVAARSVLESPQQAWRQIGGVAVTTYIGVVGGAGFALAGAASSTGMRAEDMLMTQDLRTGVLLTMLISFLLTACSVGITQAAQVLDRAELYRGLGQLGMTRTHLDGIRRRAVVGPLWIVLGFALTAAVVTTLPVLGLSLVLAPVSMLVVAATLIGGVLLVRGGVSASGPTLRGVLAAA